jgi:hypothetical protein
MVIDNLKEHATFVKIVFLWKVKGKYGGHAKIYFSF